MARFSPNARQVAYIRRYAGKFSDARMAEALGLKRAQVAHIRDARGIKGIPAGGVVSFWTPERMEVLYRSYIVEGRPASEVARLIGDTNPEAVRKRAEEAKRYQGDKWKRDPAYQLANRRANPPSRQRKETAYTPKTRFMAGTDAELVADFLARQAITVCPTGYAAGLTSYEREIHAAPAPGSSIREQHARKRREMARRAA